MDDGQARSALVVEGDEWRRARPSARVDPEAGQRQLLDRLAVADAERRHIADALHDGPVQDLASVGIRLGTYRTGLSDARERQAIDELEQTVRHALGGIRKLIVDLAPPEVDDDLETPLQAYVEETFGDDVTRTIEVDGVDPLGHELAEAAFRILQQALSNIRAHAEARSFRVHVVREATCVVGEVVDDGVGAPPEILMASTPGHLGLRRMHEQAEAVGGWVRLASGADGGVTLRFSLPLERAAPAEPPS